MEDKYSLDAKNLVSDPNPLYDKLSKISSSSLEDGYKIARDNCKEFFSNIINYPIYDGIKKDPKFVIALIQACMDIELTLDQRINCNSMIYKQLSISHSSPYLERLYSYLGLIVNRNMSYKFMKCGIPQILASYLAVVRKSSFDPKANINRLNFAITCLDPQVMTVQRIADIYATISNTIDDIKLLFIATMLDTYVFKNKDKWITDKVMQTARNMNSALLSILESVGIEHIGSILLEYNEVIESNGLVIDDVRFSLSDIDRNLFPCISYMVDSLIAKQIYLL